MKRYFFALLFMGIVGLTVSGAISQVERDALIALYNSTDGDNWTRNTGWLGDPGTECAWYQVWCNSAGTSVVKLNLDSNQLSGSIPTELGNLSNLDYLYLSSNQLSGSIPTELGNLSNLDYLYLGSNQLSGSIPTELGNLSYLDRLYLDSNQLRGSIPTELGNLSNLRDLYLYSNQLRGNIPTELTNLSSLQSINIHYNALHTDDVPLQNFINTYHGSSNFENTQTIAPENGAWFPVKTGGGELTWDAILYTGDTGGYEVWTATTSGGPYFYIEITDDKTIDSYTFDCLGPGTTYQFILRSVTEPHSANLNRVESKFSKEVEVPTSGVRGDLDERGNLDGADPVMLGDYLAGNIDAINACNIAGDLDDNFDINCVDLVNLMYILHDGGTPGSFSYLLPGNGASLDSDTIQVTLEWGTSLNAFSYYIYFGRNSDPPFYANTTSTSQEVVVSSGKTYYWKVYGKNANGTTASLSGTWSFSVDPAPPIPGQFTYISPADGTCFSSGTTAVTLQWNASQNAVSYDVYFGTDTIPAYQTNTISTSQEVVVSSGTTYYWKVYGKNANGTTASLSGTWSFSVDPEPPLPGQFTYISPADGTWFSSGTTAVTLQWNASQNAVSYDVYFGIDMIPLYHTNTTSTSQEVSVNQWTGYCWRICAINSEGVTCSRDGIWNFFTKSSKNTVDLPTEKPSECGDIDQLEIFFEFERDDEENPAVVRFYKQRTDIEFKSNKPLNAWPRAPNDFLKACPNDEPWVFLPRSFLPTLRCFSHNKKYYWRNSSRFSR